MTSNVDDLKRSQLSQLRVGAVVADKYLIEGPIGEGGKGVVYKAKHLLLHRTVALKVLLGSNTTDIERIAREARAIAKLTSPHIATVFDLGMLEDGEPYIAMEYLEGVDLGRLLEERAGALPVVEAVDYVLQACVALEEAHAAGIVHRDLKPANLFRVVAGTSVRIKVIDFGIAKVLSESSLTETGNVVGTPAYMAPEQLGGRPVDARADIWALGVILYRLVSGRHPFKYESLSGLIYEITMNAPIPLGEVSVPLERVVMRCLQKDPAARYATVRELVAALDPFRRGAADSDVGHVLTQRAAGAGNAREVEPTVTSAGIVPATLGPSPSRASATRAILRAPFFVIVGFIGILLVAIAVGRRATVRSPADDLTPAELEPVPVPMAMPLATVAPPAEVAVPGFVVGATTSVPLPSAVPSAARPTRGLRPGVHGVSSGDPRAPPASATHGSGIPPERF